MEKSPGTGGKGQEAESFLDNFLQNFFQEPQKPDAQELLFMV